MIVGTPRPVSIAFSANGATRSKRDFLGLPTKLEELTAAASAAMAAGASVFSFSTRDGKGTYSLDEALCTEALSALKEATEGRLLLQLELDTDGGGTPADFEAILRTAKPDACLMKLDQILPRDGDDGDEKAARDCLDLCEELGVGVQIALAAPGDVDWYYAFRQYGIIPESCQSVLLILGEDGEEPSSNPHSLRSYLANLEKQNLLGKIAWSVSAFGPQETHALAAAMAFGGHITPGFAYNIHNVEGETYDTPQCQLGALADMADRLGRPTASAFEARTILFGAR